MRRLRRGKKESNQDHQEENLNLVKGKKEREKGARRGVVVGSDSKDVMTERRNVDSGELFVPSTSYNFAFSSTQPLSFE